MRKGIILIFVGISFYFSSEAQLVKWTFETSVPATAGPHAAETGTGNASGLHASGSTSYSNPVGNGSGESFSSNTWAVNDYYQFQFSGTGNQNFSITWDATSSDTGPRDFKLQYSTDGISFTDAIGTNSSYSLTNDNWISGTYKPVSTRTLNLSYATSLNNATTIYIRLVNISTTSANGGTVGTSGTSRVDNFTVNIISSLPTSTDYYRSITSGDWNSTSTWETSPTNADPWSVAGTPPDFNSDSILIRNGHTVTIFTDVTADEIVIESGGVLENDIVAVNLFTIADGANDDMIIHSGGIYQVTSNQSYANHIAINSGAIIRIQTGGTIQIGDGGGVGGGNTTYASTMTSFIWEDSSIFNWNTPTIPIVQATFFPDVDASTIPIFRFTDGPGVGIGGSISTVINGLLEVYTPITFQGNSNKYFRNGIKGDSTVKNATSLRFIVNGITAELGGSGIVDVLGSGGLEIGGSPSGNITRVTSDKTIDGFVSLINSGPGTYVELDTSDLIITGGVLIGTATTYIRTNGSGRLIQNNIGAAPRVFHIGHTSYNPVTLINGGNQNFAARVDTGISPSIAFPTYGVNRTWNIQSLAATPSVGVTVRYQFAAADANPNVVPPEALEILMNDGTAWSIIPGNDSIVPTGTDPYQITTTSALTINNSTETPYCLGKKGGWILPLDCIVECRSQKQNNNGLISFEVNSCAEVNSFEIQRSSGGRPFTTIAEVPPDITKNRFSYTDADLQPGINLYRIKVNRLSGTIKYSNTTAIVNDAKGWVVTGVYPSPASDIVKLAISTARAESLQISIHNMSGNRLKQWQQNITTGSNIIETDIQQLPAGVYIFTVDEKGIKKSVRFIKN